MSESDLNIFFELAGGLSILLYGIHLLGANLQRVLGSRLEDILKKTGDNPIKGMAIGAAITAVIQSSGTTAMMLMGFISAGFLTLNNAVPVMLGASIGGTVTIQLASLHIGIYAMPILFAGFLIFSFFSDRTIRSLGKAAIGLGFLFLGMNFIFISAELLSQSSYANIIERVLSSNIPFSIIFAAVFTFLIQSGSASSVLILALGGSGILDIETAIFLILGVNLGASLKIVFLAVRGKRFSGSLAMIHLFFNFFGLIFFIIFFRYFYFLVTITSGDIVRQIANAHTIYNIINFIFFLPFIPVVIKIVEKYAPSKNIAKTELSFLDKRLIYTPSIALSQVNVAVVNMAKITYEMLDDSKKILFENRIELAQDIARKENEVDVMTGEISEYAMKIAEQNLAKKDSIELYSSMHILTDIEHMSDHILALSTAVVELKGKNIEFSEKAIHELTAIFGKLKIMQNLIIKSLEEDDLGLANEIRKHENKVDEIVKRSFNNHLQRMKADLCSVESGIYFTELLNNLERIGDHSDNIAYAVVDRHRYG